MVNEINQNSPSKGYRRINNQLRKDTGWSISNWLVHTVCKSLNIKSKAGRYSQKNPPGNAHVLYKRLVTNWKAVRPFEKIASDTTMLKHRGKRYDFTFYIDAYNNEIISYDICEYSYGVDFQHHIRALKMFCLEKIKRGYKTLETFLHTDQGVIYASRAFEKAHSDYTITRSMSRAGTPKDNGLIESVNRWIKAELKYDFKLDNYDCIHEGMAKYIDYFNNEREVYKLDNKSPVEFRIQQS